MNHRYLIAALVGVLLSTSGTGCSGNSGGGGSSDVVSDAAEQDALGEQDVARNDLGRSDATHTISALDGGTVEGPDGVLLEIPAGALAEDTEVWIEANSAALNFDGVLVGDAYRFFPTGLTFQFPVTVTLPYDPELVTSGPSVLHIWWADDESGPFEALPGWVDPATSTVTSEISHFSVGVVATLLEPSGEAWLEWAEEWRPDDLKLDSTYRLGAVKTADGGFVMSNRGRDLDYEDTFWLTVKYSKDGVRLWTDVMANADLPASLEDVIARETAEGDILLCGEDIRLTRLLDSNGLPKADFSALDHHLEFHITDCWPRAEGGVLYVGSGTDDDSESDGLLFVAVNTEGAELWDVVPAAIKGFYPSDPRMTVGADGRIYAVATFYEGDGELDSEIMTASVDANGLNDWGHSWTSEYPRNVASGLELAGDVLYVTGLSSSMDGSWQYAAALLAYKEGTLLWHRMRDGGTSERHLSPPTVFTTSQGQPLLAALSNSDFGPGMGRIHLWKFDPAGSEVFDFSASTPGFSHTISAATDPSGAAYLTVTFHTYGEHAFYRTIKVDASGAFTWAIETGTPMPTRWAGLHHTFTLEGGVFLASVAHDDGAIGYDNDGRFYMIRYGQK